MKKAKQSAKKQDTVNKVNKSVMLQGPTVRVSEPISSENYAGVD